MKTYNDSLVIADFAAMPTGCSLWPAFWSYNLSPGAWPLKGEIDVVEGVNLQATLVLFSRLQCRGLELWRIGMR